MFEVWFTHRGSRRWRVANDEHQRDTTIAELTEVTGVEDIDVIELD